MFGKMATKAVSGLLALALGITMCPAAGLAFAAEGGQQSSSTDNASGAGAGASGADRVNEDVVLDTSGSASGGSGAGSGSSAGSGAGAADSEGGTSADAGSDSEGAGQASEMPSSSGASSKYTGIGKGQTSADVSLNGSATVGTIEYNGLAYTINEEDGATVSVTGLASTRPAGDVQIPAQIASGDAVYAVTAIKAPGLSDGVNPYAQSLFDGSEKAPGVKAVSVPAKVASIDPAFFQLFPNASEINVSTDNDTYTSYDGALYDAALTKLILVPQGRGSLVLPQSLAAVPAYVLSQCDKLSAISFPGGTGSDAFAVWNNCLYTKDLTTLLAAPAGLGSSASIAPECETIAEGAFYGNAVLETMVVDGVVSEIAATGDTALSGNGQPLMAGSVVEGSTLPAFAEAVVASATVVINLDAEAEGDEAAALIEQAKAAWEAYGFQNFKEPAAPGTEIVPSDGKSGFAFALLPDYTLSVRWSGSEPPTAIDIPDYGMIDGVRYTVSTIAENGFSNYTSLVTVDIPQTVTMIGAHAFELCTNLQTVHFDSAVSIGAQAFANTALLSLVLPATVQSIGDNAFSNMKGTTIVALGSIADNSTIALGAASGLNVYVPKGTEDSWDAGIPTLGNHIYPYGVQLSAEPLELEVGETARLTDGGYIEAPGAIEASYAYKANPISINTEDGIIEAKQPGSTYISVSLELTIDQVAVKGNMSNEVKLRLVSADGQEESNIISVPQTVSLGTNTTNVVAYNASARAAEKSVYINAGTGGYLLGFNNGNTPSTAVGANLGNSYTLSSTNNVVAKVYGHPGDACIHGYSPVTSAYAWIYAKRDGYTFAGWKRSDTGAVQTTAADAVAGITYTAQWGGPYSATFDAGVGASMYSRTTGEDVGQVITPTHNSISSIGTIYYAEAVFGNNGPGNYVGHYEARRPGYTWLGWKNSATGVVTNTGSGGMTPGVTYVGQWGGPFSVYVDANGGYLSETADRNTNRGQTMTLTRTSEPVALVYGGSADGCLHTYGGATSTYNKAYAVRPGYTFIGWKRSDTGAVQTSNENTITGVTYTAQWGAPYSATFNAGAGGYFTRDSHTGANVGSIVTVKSDDRNVGVIYGKSPDRCFHAYGNVSGGYSRIYAQKPGYTFLGWKKSSDNTVMSDYSQNCSPGVTYTAQWAVVNYTITYNLNGGQLSGQKTTFTIDDADYTLPIPSRAGYTFGGWFTDSALTNSITKIAAGTSSNVTVYAKWTVNTNTVYKVQHYQEGTNGTYAVAETESLTGTTDTTATAQPKEYEGFTEKADHASRVPSGAIAGDGSLTLRLYYERISYAVAYVTNGGSAVPGASYKQGTVWGAPAAPTKTGYSFGGWYRDPALASAFTIGTDPMPIGGITLYAKWNAATDTAYTVFYHMQNIGDDSFTVDEGRTQRKAGTTGSAGTADTPEFSGFTFDGDNGDNVLSGTIAADGSLELHAYYTRNSYTVTYTGEGAPSGAGELPEAASYRFEQEVEAAEGVDAPGYTFEGWAATPSVAIEDGVFSMPASDVVMKGIWAPRTDLSYTVRHRIEGTEADLTEPVTYGGQTMGASVTASASSFEGYLLAGDEVQTLTISADSASNAITFYYTPKSYTVRFWMYSDAGGDPILKADGSPLELALAYRGEPAEMPRQSDISDGSKLYGYLVAGFEAQGPSGAFEAALSPDKGDAAMLSAEELVEALGDREDGGSYDLYAKWNAVYKVSVPTSEVGMSIDPSTREIAADREICVRNASPREVYVGAYSTVAEGDMERAKALFLDDADADASGLAPLSFAFAGESFAVSGGPLSRAEYATPLSGASSADEDAMASLSGPLALGVTEDVWGALASAAGGALSMTDAELERLGLTREGQTVRWGRIATITWLISSSATGDYGWGTGGIGAIDHGPFSSAGEAYS